MWNPQGATLLAENGDEFSDAALEPGLAEALEVITR